MRGLQVNYVHVLIAIPFVCPAHAAQSIPDESRPDNYLFPAKDVNPDILKSGDGIVVTESAEAWSFTPAPERHSTALLFFPGGGVDPKAYAPLARAVAADGFAVHVAKLPRKPAAPDAQRENAIEVGKAIISANPGTKRWVVGGHSLGATVAARYVYETRQQFRGLVLIGTTHPRDFDLSSFAGDVTKVYATEDSVANQAKSEASRKLLPAGTTWVRVEGGNHAQFGSYGSQPGDGEATISREAQQQVTRETLASALQRVSDLAE